MGDDTRKKLVLMYRPTIRIEVPFDEEHYPGMTVVQALQHEASKTVADQVEEIIEFLSNTRDLGDLHFTVAATLACFEDPASQVPDAHTMLASLAGDVPDIRVAEPVCPHDDCGCTGLAHD